VFLAAETSKNYKFNFLAISFAWAGSTACAPRRSFLVDISTPVMIQATKRIFDY